MSTHVITKKRLVTGTSAATSATDAEEAVGDATSGPPAVVSGRRPWRARPTPAMAAVGALVLVLAAAVGYLWLQLDDSRSEVERLESAQVTRAEVLERSRDLAIALTTYDYRDLDAQQRLLDEGSTDAFQQKFAETNETLAPMFAQLEASAKGSVVDAAVQKIDGDLATVLVFADQSASSKQSAEPTTQASRLRLHLVRHADTWLLDSVDLL